VKFLDSDDLLAPDVLRLQIEALEQSSADVVYGDVQFTGNLKDSRVGGAPLRRIGHISDFVDEMIANTNLFSNFIYLYTADCLKSIRWNLELECLQDVDFTLQVAMSGARFTYLPGVAGYYRMHTGQITSQSQLKYAENHCRLLNRARRNLEERQMLTSHRCILMAHGYWSAARVFYRHDQLRFRENLRIIAELDPQFKPVFSDVRLVRVLTRWMGIERAEKILSIARNLLER
jgi:hypothetical protein